MGYSITNWREYQHYTDGRTVHWVKVYRKLLDDIEWHSLSGDAAKLLVNLWLIAAENNGELPDVRTLAFRLRCSVEHVETNIVQLRHWVCTDSYQIGTESYAPAESVLHRIKKEEIDIDKEKEEERDPAQARAESVPAVECVEMIEYWNSKDTLPKARGITDGRNARIRRILKDKVLKDTWRESIDNAAQSKFHCGENDRGWRICFDWWCRPEKVLFFLEMKKTQKEIDDDDYSDIGF